jgi:PGF-CTERM protein
MTLIQKQTNHIILLKLLVFAVVISTAIASGQAAAQTGPSVEWTDSIASGFGEANSSAEIGGDQVEADGQTISLTPASQSATPDTEITYDVVIRNTSNGVGSLNTTIAVANPSVAEITDVTEEIGASIGVTEQVTNDGSSATITGAVASLDTTGNVTIATVTMEGVTIGSTTLSIESVSVGDTDGNPYTINEVNNASVTVSDNNPPDRTPLNLTINQTSIVTGESIRFVVTDSTGSPVTATVRIPGAGTARETGPDGAVSISVTQPGRYRVVATKEQTGGREFSPATEQITVSSPTVNIGQSALEFETVPVSTIKTVELTVQNDAPASIPIDRLRLTGPDAEAFRVNTTNDANEIPANSEVGVNISFIPNQAGAANATLNINDQSVGLTGVGSAPEIQFESALPVEITAEPGKTVSKTVTVRNDGNAPLSAALESGDQFTHPARINVAAGRTASFRVEFTPQTADSQQVNSRLTITPDTEAISVTAIPIIGTTINRNITITTRDVALGNVTVGEQTTVGIVVSNSGTTTETISATTDTGAFNIPDEDKEFTISPGGQVFLSVEVAPTDPGEVTGSLTVETDDGDVSDTTTLTATGQAPAASIVSPDPLSFGATPLNSTTTRAVEITNEGDAPLTVTVNNVPAEAPFRSVGDNQIEIQPGQSQSLSIGFTPQTVGETTADLTLTTNDPETTQTSVTLEGEGVETDIGLTPNTVSFGTVGVSSSITETVTLENGGSEFTIDDITVNGTGFELADEVIGTTVSEGENVDIDVLFDPEAAGGQAGTITINGSTQTDTTEVSTALTGTGQTAGLQLSSQTLRTGVAVTDETTTGSITVENTGLAGTQLTVNELTLNDTAQFSLSSDSINEETTITGQTGAPITVTFTPATANNGVQETTLTLEASSGEKTITRTIPVTGIVSAPEPTVSADEIDVGTLSVGETTRRTVTVSNDGGEPFQISDVSAVGSGIATSVRGPSEVVPGEERPVAVTVNQSTAGNVDTTVDITTTAPNNPSVAVTGQITAPTFAVGTESIIFDDTSTGSASQQTVTIENRGSAPLTVAAPSVGGADSGAFSILSGDQRLRIAGGNSETVTVGFSPDTTGEQTATLSVEPLNDASVDAPAEITLSGSGTESDVGLSDSAVGFGTLRPGSTQAESLELTNDGNTAVEITGTSVTGADSSAVSVNALQRRVLQPGETEPFEIQVNTAGRDRGRLTAQITIGTADTTVRSSVGGTVASPEIAVEPSVEAEVFGVTRVGETSTASVQIENTGNADLNLTEVSPTGADAAAFSVVEQPTGAISPQSSGRIVVEFDPATLPDAADRAQNTPLEASASLEVDSNAGDTQSVSLSGEAKTASLTTSRTFQFGETPIGETTARTLTIENSPSATTSLNITEVALSGRDADQYEAMLIESELPALLAPGDSTSVNVSLTPTSLGQKFATLTIRTADPRQPVKKIGLSNSETIYSVDYGSINVQYINPTAGQEPTVDVDQGLQGQNATLTNTNSEVNTTNNYALNYTFGTTPSEVGDNLALQNDIATDTAIQYINATTTASADEFNESVFQIEVSKAALARENTTAKNVTIYHESSRGYETVETSRLFETLQGHVYRVTSDRYSVFAVGVPAGSDGGDDGDGGDGSDDGDGGGGSDDGDGSDGGDDGDGGDEGDDGDGGDEGDDGDGGDRTESTEPDTDNSTAGFGVIVALLAIAATVVMITRHQ